MTDRTITLRLSSEDMTIIAEAVGSWEKLWNAIGYLTTWNPGTYPHVEVFRDRGDTDLVAVYKDASAVRGYVIGAVWHDDHYGFHS